MIIGVAGCGRMGLPMAQAMVRGGLEVYGFDVRSEFEFGEFQSRMIADPRGFAQTCDTIFTVVRDIIQTNDLLFADQALLAGPHSIKRLIVCSTLSPKYAKALAGRVPEDIALIDAPMSGAVVAAEEARLSFMLGGKSDDLDALQPVLEIMGTSFHRMGPFGSGMATKVLNNFVTASSVTAVRQVLQWAEELDIDQDRLLALIHDSSGQTWFGSAFNDIEFSRDGYSDDNTIGILRKDVESMLDAVGVGTDEGLQSEILNHIMRFKPIT